MKSNAFFTIFYTVSLSWLRPGTSEMKSYEGAQVWRSTIRDLGDLEVLKGLAAKHDISMWKLTPTRAEYLLHDDKRAIVNRALQGQNMNHTVIIMSVQRRIDISRSQSASWTEKSLRLGHRLDFASYPKPDIIDEYYNYLQDNYDSMCRIEGIGTSFENRTIKLIKISNGDPKNKPIMIVSGMHSREWIAITSALYIADNIITKYDEQPSYVKNKDWYIVPLLNPDGYAFSHNNDRLWRKNRAPLKDNICYGVDINRNFGQNWEKSNNYNGGQCEEDYAGPHPFSEPESRALRVSINDDKWGACLKNYIQAMKPNLPHAFIDLHSFGQLILYPYGTTKEVSPNKFNLENVGELMSAAIKKATGHKYVFGTPPSLMYDAPGTAMDWMHAKGVPLSFAIETRDLGSHGFLLPPDAIHPTGKEMLGAVRTVAKNFGTNIQMRGQDLHRWL